MGLSPVELFAIDCPDVQPCVSEGGGGSVGITEYLLVGFVRVKIKE